MATAYRVTVKTDHFRTRDFQPAVRIVREVRRGSEKADRAAVAELEAALAQHAPEGDKAFAWAERSDRYGVTSLASYRNVGGKWQASK